MKHDPGKERDEDPMEAMKKITQRAWRGAARCQTIVARGSTRHSPSFLFPTEIDQSSINRSLIVRLIIEYPAITRTLRKIIQGCREQEICDIADDGHVLSQAIDAKKILIAIVCSSNRLIAD